jgi:MerR family transcriptional regulator/heat shock protein HspR
MELIMTASSKDNERALFMISVAAKLAGMHPQTLRLYEQKGLITPSRTPKNTRLYSEEDIDRLRHIQKLTTDMGMNLAGVERVMELEEQVIALQEKIVSLRRKIDEAARNLHEEVDAVHKSYRRELALVPKGELMVIRKTRQDRKF